jgi:O-antigen ligase
MFLSADVAQALGVAELRIAGYLAALGSLLLFAVLAHPPASGRSRAVPIILLVLLVAIAALDTGPRTQLLDYKILLPVIVLLITPSLARSLASTDLAELVWRLLAFYLLVTAATSASGLVEPDIKGHDALVRYDFSGSVVSYSSLALITLIVTAARLPALRGGPIWLLHVLLATVASVTIFLTATRTVLVTLAVFALLQALAAREPGRCLRRTMGLAAGLCVAFLLHTWLVSDAFLKRLLGQGVRDYSSGRWTSQLHWLRSASEHPLGLGLGTVRDTLARTRPPLGGDGLLEWPHNELIRFYVEAGPLGLAFILLLLGFLLARGVRAARVDSDGTRRALILAILADMIGQCLFQNYLNAIYQSTSLILVLATSIEMIGEEQALSARPLTMRRSGCRINRAMAEVQAVSAQR